MTPESAVWFFLAEIAVIMTVLVIYRLCVDLQWREVVKNRNWLYLEHKRNKKRKVIARFPYVQGKPYHHLDVAWLEGQSEIPS